MNTLLLLLPLAWRNLWRNQRRTAIILVAISIGVWAIIFVNAFLEAWLASSLHDAINTLTGHGQIHAQHYLDDPSIEHRLSPPAIPLQNSLNSTMVAVWSQRIRVPAMLRSAHGHAPVILVGIEPLKERGLSFIATAIHNGNYLRADETTGILIGRKLAERLETSVGKRVVLMSQDVEGAIAERGFQIQGIFTASKETTETVLIFVTLNSAQNLLNMNHDISEIAFVLHDIQQLPRFISQLRQIAPTLDIASWDILQPLAQALFQISDGVMGLLAVIMFIAMAFGIINTLLMAVLERVREFGLLQALGMQPVFILGQVLLESMLLMGLGVGLGILLGAATILACYDGIDLSGFASALAYWSAEKVLYPQIDYLDLFQIGSLVWIMGTIVSLYPAWLATRYVPVVALSRVT